MTDKTPPSASADNPAGRLLAVLEQLDEWRANTGELLAKALARALDDDVKSRRFMRRCVDLRDQAYEVQDLMTPLLPDLLGSEHSFAEYDTVLAAADLIQQCHNYNLGPFLNTISQQGWYALKFADTVLSKRATEPVIDQQQVQKYISQVRNLIDRIQADDQIALKDRAYLTGLLADIETALRDIRITGTAEVRRAVNAAVGALATDPVRRQSWYDRPFIKAMGAVLIGLATIVGSYSEAKEIATDAGWLDPPAITRAAEPDSDSHRVIEIVEAEIVQDEIEPEVDSPR